MIDVLRGTARWWIVFGIAGIDVGAVLFAVAWADAAMGRVPFAPSWPPGFLVVAAVAGFMAVIDVGLWRASSRIVRSSRG